MGLELGEQGFEGAGVFQAFEVGILGHPVVVGVAELHGFAEGAEGVGAAFGEGEAAGEIVAGGGVVGLQLDELPVHFEAIGDAAGFGVETAQEFYHVLVAGFAAEDGFVEGDVEGGIFFAGHGPSLSVIFANATLLERNAVGADLKALGNGSEAEFGRNGAAIPLHERGADLEDFVAVHADDLGDLGVVVGDGQVELDVGADVHFAEEGAFGHDRERAIDGGAGDGIVDGSGVIEEFLGGEVLFAGEGGLEDGQSLVGHAETFAGEVVFEFFAGRVVAHGKNVSGVTGRVNWFVGTLAGVGRDVQ